MTNYRQGFQTLVRVIENKIIVLSAVYPSKEGFTFRYRTTGLILVSTACTSLQRKRFSNFMDLFPFYKPKNRHPLVQDYSFCKNYNAI